MAVTTAVVGVAVLAHLATPFALAGLTGRRLGVPSRRPRTLGPLRRRVLASPRRAYGDLTVALGVVVVAAFLVDQHHGIRARLDWGVWTVVPGVFVGAALGVVFPLVAALLSGRRRGAAQRRPTARMVSRTVLVAAAEEVLWRVASVAVLVYVGFPLVLAIVVGQVGFALIHAPLFGHRVLPYQFTFGLMLAGLTWGIGLLPAVACHAFHNLVLASTAPRCAGQRMWTKGKPPVGGAKATDVGVPTELPAARGWSGRRT